MSEFSPSLGAVVFDLDGTLVDSVGDLAWCGDEMLRQLGLPPRGKAAVINWVGNGMERLIKEKWRGRGTYKLVIEKTVARAR